MSNVYAKYDDYSSEDYLCHKLKPKGELLCGYCDQPYFPYTFEATCNAYGDTTMMTVCKSCGEVGFVYNEE